MDYALIREKVEELEYLDHTINQIEKGLKLKLNVLSDINSVFVCNIETSDELVTLILGQLNVQRAEVQVDLKSLVN